MSIKINGTELKLNPTSHGWVSPSIIGRGGAGHPFYSSVKEYEMRWQLISSTDLNQLVGFFNSVTPTGTVVVDLPRYGYTTYTYFSYSGCILNSPEISEYFAEHTTEVRLVISNIRT